MKVLRSWHVRVPRWLSMLRAGRGQRIFFPGLACEISQRRFQSHHVEEEYTMDVSNLPARWNNLPGDAQQDIINYLKVKQEFGWTYLTRDEKQAIYYISYGEWGPRDAKSMGIPDLVFKIMSSSILFGVVGFTLINYARDQTNEE
ncbi:hypothetical protein KL930_001570 [Ogataea haglerorum]|uniref:Uncharacterized protein n=1 Tax=Ogataea haglerorum TaxID=1937702 RepID=A0ABQ7RAB4_9ASCO|nr:uncharacterized protein KL911_004416 [Ogataea haglerorum]KAG7692068.1 hypothetical protein KL915_004828 [Ogataea haglerorum]KAG7703680.1 hypothetical protein KL914_004637 [Ogataea haglerorum]KAG7704073.1 hypothetical protein KL950_004400 [Ogataea haglerorum]KAG7726041.1 hypothetical protein KL948_004776 [Ogataea haglerorum]KAG7735238.1 hypothetical protein KL932_004685 [Ogataea haglerorum]